MSKAVKAKKASGWQTAKDFFLAVVAKAGQDNLPRLASSFSFFALLSFAPFLVFAVTIGALLLGRNQASDHLLTQAAQIGGPQLRDYLETIINSSQHRATGVIATVLSLGVTFYSASNLFMNLDDAVNSIWGIKAGPSFIKNLITTRIVAFLAVLIFGGILMAWLVMDMVLGYIAKQNSQSGAWAPVSFLATIFFFTFAFSITLHSLPRKKLHWRDAFPGAAITGISFAVSKFLLAFYFQRLSGVYTAAGGVVVLLLWMYYSSMIYFLGVDITYVYSHSFGSLKDKAEESATLASNPALQTS
jgi:membrane protein